MSKKKITKIVFSRLRKLEVRNLGKRVIEIVEDYDPEALEIKEIYDLLVEKTPQIEFLDIPYGKHPISSDLKVLRRKRKAIAQGLVDQIKSIENGKMIGTDKDLNVVKPFVLDYLKGFWSKGEVEIVENVNLFFQHIKLDPELSTAFSTLELNNQVSSLQSVTSDIEMQYNARRKNLSTRPKNPTPGIVADLKQAIEDLFKQIDIAQIKNQEIDYKPLIDELNKEIAYHEARLNARASYNKKKAEEALNNKDTEIVEKQDEVIIEPASEEPSESTQSTKRMYPTNVEVDNEEDLEQLDIKTTAAVSTKQTRLPIGSPEA